MQTTVSRRALLNGALVAAAALPLLKLGTRTAEAAALVPLDPSDPSAKALAYSADSAKVDAAANPTHKAEQVCSNCAQYQGKAGDAQAGCNLFPGKSVSSKGWCKVWAKKPGT